LIEKEDYLNIIDVDWRLHILKNLPCDWLRTSKYSNDIKDEKL